MVVPYRQKAPLRYSRLDAAHVAVTVEAIKPRPLVAPDAVEFPSTCVSNCSVAFVHVNDAALPLVAPNTPTPSPAALKVKVLDVTAVDE